LCTASVRWRKRPPPVHSLGSQEKNATRSAHRLSVQKTTFALHNRTFARAAGVSPPWFYEPHLQVICDEVPRLDVACGVQSTGGLRQPLLVARRSFAVKNDIRAAQTHVFKSGGCQPAVVFGTASASAVRRTSAFGSRVLSALHGGLTPPALGAVRPFAGEKTIFRCRNARSQERRASARRGFPNRICKCNAMNFGVRVSRPECIPRGAYAPRSWLHDVRSQ
jgi:hypothetical protein